MGYMAQWGKKGFVISPTKVAPIMNISTGLKLKTNSENDTSGTVTSNTRGRELQQMKFETKYLKAAGVDPRSQIDEWEAELGNAYPLYIGGKRFGPPKLKLTSFDLSEIELTPSGNMLSVKISINLEEYDESNKSALLKNKSSNSKSAAMLAAASASDKANLKPSATT